MGPTMLLTLVGPGKETTEAPERAEGAQMRADPCVRISSNGFT